jgi:hypothetical protein
VSDRDREIRALRVIAVSGRAALARAREPEERNRLRQRANELLADLEQEVIRDGAEERILAAIVYERRRIWED